MTSSEKKNKKTGVLGTILFHALLLVSFFFMGLTYQDPPPSEEGININFGYSDYEKSELKSENIKELPEFTQKETINKNVENTEQIITQSEIESPSIRENEMIEEEKTEEKIIEEEKEEINQKALYSGKKKTNKIPEGGKKDEGIQGSIHGETHSGIHNGSLGNNGTAYQLGGRNAEHKPKPIYDIQAEGKVVVIITVNRDGNVINAIPGAKGSSTLNKQLLQRAKNAALKTKFNKNISAPNNQQGKIIYYFTLN